MKEWIDSSAEDPGKELARGTADSKCKNYKSLVQDFTQLSRNLLEFHPIKVYSDSRLVASKGRYDVVEIIIKFLDFSTKG